MLKPTRVRFYDLFFYVANVANEWRRWEWLFQPSIRHSRSVATRVRPWRSWPEHSCSSGKVVAFVSVLGTFLSLAILDSIKARIYRVAGGAGAVLRDWRC